MNKEEIDKLFRRIELDKSNDSCGFEFADGFSCTFDNIATCYDDRLKLYDLVKQLQNNWNELKQEYDNEVDENCKLSELWCKSQNNWNELRKYLEDCYDYSDCLRIKPVLDKMQEIESRK